MKASRKVGFVSLGCPKNLVDSEVMMGTLARDGYTLTTDTQAAEIIVVNTCGFIDAARQESVDAILEVAQLKRTGRLKRLVVAGCLVERYREDLQRQIPEVDACIGVNQIDQIIAVAREGAPRPLPVYSEGASAPELYLYDETTPRLRATAPYSAYVKIAEGCDHTCAFCIIPSLRGRFRSRSPESILRETKMLAEQGVKEVVLVSQDTTNYGSDLGLKEGLPKLLQAIADSSGIEWIRFLYCYPTAVTRDLLSVVASNSNICPYFDIPLQHASRNVLSRMRRGGSPERYERLVDTIRTRVPNASVRTTFIVGFPGEAEADFDQLVSFVRRVQFDRVGVFTYSDEATAPACNLEGKVPARAARLRERRLMAEQSRISLRKNKALVGRTVTVLLEGKSRQSDLLLEGRMATQAPEIDGSVLINDFYAGWSGGPGDFVNVEITGAHHHDLVGRITS